MNVHSQGGRSRLREFRALCRQKGLPVTVQRRAILEEIAERKDHPTADSVFEAVQERIPGISRTTVYRVLNMLVELGIIKKIYQPGAAARFDPSVHQHHHLACSQCGRVIDVEDERLSAIAFPDLRDRGFEISESHIYFRGTCPECRRKTARTNGMTDATGGHHTRAESVASEARGSPSRKKRRP
jgi:Fur family peroxide stress response transcriptional regulator